MEFLLKPLFCGIRISILVEIYIEYVIRILTSCFEIHEVAKLGKGIF